jgi:hypothetical protein
MSLWRVRFLEVRMDPGNPYCEPTYCKSIVGKQLPLVVVNLSLALNITIVYK